MGKKFRPGRARLEAKSSKKKPTAPKVPSVNADVALSVNVLKGEEGHTLQPSAADAAYAHQTAVNLEFALANGTQIRAGSSIWMVELFEAIGVTSYVTPMIRTKAMIEFSTKMLSSANFDAVVQVFDRLLFGHPDHPEGAILTAGLALIVAPPNQTVVQMRQMLGFAREKTRGSMPRCRLREAKANSLSAAVAWLFETPSASQLTKGNKGGPVLATSTETITKAMGSRLLEIASQRDPVTSMAGVGRWVALVRGVRTKMAHWQKGGANAGMVMDANFDPWSFWFERRSANKGNALAPVRWDVLPKATAPLPPRPWTKRSALPPAASARRESSAIPRLAHRPATLLPRRSWSVARPQLLGVSGLTSARPGMRLAAKAALASIGARKRASGLSLSVIVDLSVGRARRSSGHRRAGLARIESGAAIAVVPDFSTRWSA